MSVARVPLGHDLQPCGIDSESEVQGLICCSCNLILKNAIQTSEEGLRMCQGCYHFIQRQKPKDGFCYCPRSKTKLKVKERYDVDNAARKAVLGLTVKCANKNCSWTGKLENHEMKHRKECKAKKKRRLSDFFSKQQRSSYNDPSNGCSCRCKDCKCCNHPHVPSVPTLEYEMSCDPHGIAMIIGNDWFLENPQRKELGLERRKGCKEDVTYFKETFRYLGYSVDDHCHKNVTANEMYSLVTNIASLDHSDFDSFVLCISSHGEENNFVFGNDSRRVNIYKLVRIVQNCPTLLKKPKLFFIQSCRSPSTDLSQLEHSSLLEDDDNAKCNYDSDVYLAWATSRSSRSYRSPKEGSWFPKAIHDQFTKHAHEHHLMSMMYFVAEEVQNCEGYDSSNGEMARQFIDGQIKLAGDVFFYGKGQTTQETKSVNSVNCFVYCEYFLLHCCCIFFMNKVQS